ncbi:MAG: MBL fold metallo-hydrolase [Mycobacteriales bacterium]|nr:MAG: MBL fold metallo-hydrolase [Pseudonocardiales bacterium]
MAEVWRRIADGVHVRRHASLDLNVGLVLGRDRCLVIDTRCTAEQARELTAAVRTVTPLPWTVVNTHAHYDHCFGNHTFRPAPIWGHRRCAKDLSEMGAVQRDGTARMIAATGDAAFAAALAATVIDPPDHLVDGEATLDLGGRTVNLRFLGRGHTDHDLVVEVPDSDLVFAGDLVEEGGAPSFDDAYPLDWPATARRLESLARGPVVPGHGAVVDRAFVAAQATEFERLAVVARAAHMTGTAIDAAARGTPPFGPDIASIALRRAGWQLDGEPSPAAS